MNRRQGWILLSLGLVLAIGTGVLVYFLLLQQQQVAAERALSIVEENSPPEVATLELPVAARPLLPGMTISTEDFLMKEFPLDLVPVAAITSTIDLENQVLVEPVGQGETFNNANLAGSNAARVSQQLPEGQVLFAFPVVDLMSQLGLVNDGDRIDLLLTIQVPGKDGTSSTQVTGYTLQNLNVFQVLRPVDEDGKPSGAPIALLLSVTPEQAVLLKHVKDAGGTMDYVLRSTLDIEVDERDVPAVDREDLIARYHLR